MGRVKVGDEVAVMNNGSWTRGKVDAIHKGGSVDVTVQDGADKGKKLTNVQHASGTGTYWHSKDTSEKLAETQNDASAIEIA